MFARWAAAIPIFGVLSRFTVLARRHSIGLLALYIGAVFILTLPSFAQAQPDANLRVAEIRSTNTSFFDVIIEYTTAFGKPIEGETDFAITVAGRTVPIDAIDVERVPVDVALVTDLSARMSDTGAPFTTRFDNMLPLVKDLISQLQAGANNAALVTFTTTENLPHVLGGDLQAIANTFDRGNPNLLFEAAPLESADETTPYPLVAAVRLALAQLVTGTGTSHPQALVIFAAGAPLDPLAVETLRAEITTARANQRPIRVLIFGFGTDREGGSQRFPAGTSDLRDLAAALGGDFIDLGDQLLTVQLRQIIDAEFGAIIARGNRQVLSIDTSGLPIGDQLLQVSASDGAVTSAPAPLTIAAHAPRFAIAAPALWEGDVTLAIADLIAQSPILTVEYQLDNYKLAESTDSAANFAVTLDAGNREFLQNYTPGAHTLTAVAFDAGGLQGEAAAPITITIAEPPPPVGPLSVVGAVMSSGGAIIGVVVVALAVGAGIAILLSRRPGGSRSTTDTYLPNPKPQSADEELTTRYGEDDEATSRVDPEGASTSVGDETTLRVDDADDDKTLRYQPAAAPAPMRWKVVILEGAELQTFTVSTQRRYYDIGRPSKSHTPHIAVNNPLVSRHHAQLECLPGGLDLIVLETENGTFFGEDRQELQPKESKSLQPGDIFWLSQSVKLCVERESPTDEH